MREYSRDRLHDRLLLARLTILSEGNVSQQEEILPLDGSPLRRIFEECPDDLRVVIYD